MSLARRSVIESIDGAGKTVAAHGTALNLSGVYRDKRIAVVDSTGVYRYQSGELSDQSWTQLENLEPHQSRSKLVIAAKLGAFTLARRMVEGVATRHADLVIGVRDPYRIDPAAYALVFGPSRIRKLSAVARLRMFSSFTNSIHPEIIVHLQTDPLEARPSNDRNNLLDSHETVEKMKIVSDELPLVLAGYKKLFGTEVAQVQALRPSTTDQVTARIEPLLVTSMSNVAVPSLPTAML